MGCALSDPFDISTTLNHRALIPIHSCRRWRGCSTSCGIRPTRACRGCVTTIGRRSIIRLNEEIPG